MKTLLKSALLLGVVSILLCGTPIPAPEDYIGSRSSPDGVFATAGWDGDFTIWWEVTFVGGDLPWQYSYRFTGAGGTTLAKNLSHMIIQLSEVDGARYEFPAGTDPDAPKTYGPAPSNPGIPGEIFGVKWDCAAGCGTPTFTFLTTQAPMWGSFYAKDGVDGGEDVYAYNHGFGTSPLDGEDDFTWWIVTPDTDEGGPVIPEPTTMGLLAGGLGALALARLRKR